MIKEGSTVKIHYTLTVDGETVDTSQGREPLTYVQGAGQIIPGLEEQLSGMETGDTASVKVSPEKGYGEHDPSAVHTVKKEVFTDPSSLQVGGMVQGKTAGGQPFRATIREMEGDEVQLDLNHPLAGKTLEFEVEVVEVG